MTFASSLLRRMTAAALLRSRVYEEINQVRGTGLQAMTVLLLMTLARGAGRVGIAESEAPEWLVFLEGAFLGLVWWTVFTLAGFVIAAMITPRGARPRQAQMARLIAFAQAPGALWILGFVPRFGLTLVSGVVIWQLAATAVAIQHALGEPSAKGALKAVLVTAAGLALWFVIQWMFQ